MPTIGPYVRRHTGLTDKAQLPKVPFAAFVQHGGWTEGSKMPWIYIHQLSHASRDAILASWDIETKTNKSQRKPIAVNCSCGTANKPMAKYYVICNRVLSYEGMIEVQEARKKQQTDITSLRDEVKQLREMVYPRFANCLYEEEDQRLNNKQKQDLEESQMMLKAREKERIEYSMNYSTYLTV